jgi:Ca2+-binding EF-hand superfamily protein
MIDKNEDNTISLREFSQMFEQMEIPLTSDAMKELFYAINRHASAEITYN